MFYTDRHKFIHTHNLLQYYKVGDQASVEVEGVEEQMLIFLSSLTPGRVKGFWIVLIWKIPACLKFGKTSILMYRSNRSFNMPPPGIPQAFDTSAVPESREFDYQNLPGGGEFELHPRFHVEKIVPLWPIEYEERA